MARQPTKFNGRIARRVMELHTRGFDNDFFERGENTLVSMQSLHETMSGQAEVRLVDQCPKLPGNSFVYLHTVETSDGEKGLLITDRIRNNF